MQVQLKRSERRAIAVKFEFGSECPICKHQLTAEFNREHVIFHFIDDLKKLVISSMSYEGGGYKCWDCADHVDKLENMAK